PLLSTRSAGVLDDYSLRSGNEGTRGRVRFWCFFAALNVLSSSGRLQNASALAESRQL
ncbi:Uncharacterized protein DAT39_017449, partial [Clarias magur]